MGGEVSRSSNSGGSSPVFHQKDKTRIDFGDHEPNDKDTIGTRATGHPYNSYQFYKKI